MVTEEKAIKKRYVPVAVTAKKVGELEGEDILKIDMPVYDNEKIEKKIEKEREKEEIDNMAELSEALVEKKFSEMLGKLKLQETIDKIMEKNEEIDKRIEKIDERFSGKLVETSDKLEELNIKQGKLQDNQEEICSGVDCVKKGIGKIDELKTDVVNIKENTEKLNEALGAEYAKCSGPKGCNEDIKIGSSFCPNCGARISEWEGHPEWVPYWKRQAR